MKKFITLTLIAFFATSLFAGRIIHSYNSISPTAKDVGNLNMIMFEGMYLTGKTGEPVLPYQAVKLLLPPGEEAVSVIWKFENELIIAGNFTLYPQQPVQPYSVGAQGIFQQNMDVYSSGNVYPAEAMGRYSTHFLNGHGFLLATFTPVKYIPATGQVSFFQKVTIQVETRKTERAERAFRNINNNDRINSVIKDFAQNPEMISSYPEKLYRDGEYQYLIITPEQFAPSFQALTDLYRVRGYITEIATTESIDATMPGQDLQEKIRNYIIAAVQANGVEHVLLGGDVEHIPHRGFYCHVQSSSVYEDWNIPADLYYSALDGNWDTDGDGIWGEIGEDDLLPDVAVTRMPISTSTQLQRMLNKTIMYQDQPVAGEMRDIISAGENLWSDPLTYGEDYLELLFGWHDDNGYVTDGIPEDYDVNRLYDSQMYWDKYTLMNAINQGSSFIHHSGHANQTYVMRFDMSDISNENFSQVNGTDHNYALIYTHGCLCGAFDESDCIGERMVLIDNLAVAGGFNSRYGWFNEGQTEGPSAHLHREFVDALYHEKEWRIGAAHMISKIETSVWVNAPGQWEQGALRWCFYDCNIFGDALLGVWTEEPVSIETTYPEEIYPGETTVQVSIANGDGPAVGFNCVIMSAGEMIGCATTDESGQAEISVPEGFIDHLDAQLIVSGYNCLPHTYDLNIVVGIDEPYVIDYLNIIPNPFRDQTSLVYQLEEAGSIEVTFVNLAGQMIEKMQFDGKKGINRFNINTTEWPEGMIISKITGENRTDYYPLLHIKN
ncbi:MAG TPA: C25 family cysteine peptidase [Bacteroidales bacterium]|nr:C25 family cysteine peptidase [Bacteroidales bacterium]